MTVPVDYVQSAFPGGGIELKSCMGEYEMKVHSDFVWVDPEITVTVPKGYKFDGASIPRSMWRVIGGPWGPYRDAAAVHDYLYSDGHREYPEVTRKQADGYFRKIMKQAGVSSWLAWTMHKAVRAGGWVGWNKHRRV